MINLTLSGFFNLLKIINDIIIIEFAQFQFPKRQEKREMENLPSTIFSSIDDFILTDESKPLGSGSFGIVRKACHKMTGKIYAIKIIQLDENMNQPEMLLLSREISVHFQLNHPHIVKLWAVFEQNDKVYMVMDYAENGNLFNYLNRKKAMTEVESYKIFIQVLDAIQYLHKFDHFHRDIKPENILLDAQHNVRLCDFGWVADEIHKRRQTFCGTYEYMAPQMVQDQPYNYKIDIWALGILLFELNHGRAPFPANSAEQIKQKFEVGSFEIKQTLSQELKKLILGILKFDPKSRLEIVDIKNSDWVKKFKNLYSSNSQITCSSYSRNLQGSGGSKMDIHCSSLLKTKQSVKQSDEAKHKKFRKKYKTLEQEDLNCLTQNLKFSKHGSIKDFPKQSVKQSTMKQKWLKEAYGNKQNTNTRYENQKQKQKQKKQQPRKKKVGSTRTHMRTGTETSQLLHKKLSKIIFQEKLKLYHDDRKKKIGSRRN